MFITLKWLSNNCAYCIQMNQLTRILERAYPHVVGTPPLQETPSSQHLASTASASAWKFWRLHCMATCRRWRFWLIDPTVNIRLTCPYIVCCKWLWKRLSRIICLRICVGLKP